jgi:hypothetical protein
MLEVRISLSLSPSLLILISLALEAVGVDPTTARYTPSGEAIDRSTFVKHMYVTTFVFDQLNSF